MSGARGIAYTTNTRARGACQHRSGRHRARRIFRLRSRALRRMPCELVRGGSESRRRREGAAAGGDSIRGAAARRDLFEKPDARSGDGHRPLQRRTDCAHDALQRAAERTSVGGADDAVSQHERRGHDRDHFVPQIAASCAQCSAGERMDGAGQDHPQHLVIIQASRRRDVRPPKVAPEEKPTKERGEYLARYVANCVGCHTPLDDTTFEPSGRIFRAAKSSNRCRCPASTCRRGFARRTSRRRREAR